MTMSDYDDQMPILNPRPLKIDEEKEDEIPEHIIKEVERDELFDDVIGSVIEHEPRPEWKEAISNSQCFARQWKDPDDNSYCSVFSCDLRKLCEQTWEHVQYGYAFEFSGTHPNIYRFAAKKPYKRFGPPKRKIPKKDAQAQISEKNYHKRKFKKPLKRYLEYRPTGRPIDYIAQELYNFLDSPKPLPETFKPFVRLDNTMAQQRRVVECFIDTYGPNVRVLRRMSYHLYYFRGKRLCRLHMSSAQGGFMDCSELLSITSYKMGLKLEKVPYLPNNPKKYKDFTHRIYFKNRKDLKKFFPVFTRLKGLSHLRKNLELDEFGL